MDYRLDLYNALKNYEANRTDDDNHLVLLYNKKDTDIGFSIMGDPLVFCGIASNETNFIDLSNPSICDTHRSIQIAILNMALSIINNNDEMKALFNEQHEALRLCQ